MTTEPEPRRTRPGEVPREHPRGRSSPGEQPPVSGGPEGANTGTGALGQGSSTEPSPDVSGRPEGANTGSGARTARKHRGLGEEP
jgi:hypothetical protein